MRRTPALLATVLACLTTVSFGVAAAAQARQIGSFTSKGAWSYWSAPNLHPPKLSTDKPVVGSKLFGGGYFMTSNFYNLNSPTPIIGQSGPLILNNGLQPVWFKPVPKNVVANNLETQTFNGKPALSWWQGVVTNTGATVSGEYVVVDQSYKTVATLKGAGGWVLSLHDFRISGHDAWVTAYKNVPKQNLKAFGGSASGTVLDVAVQEYDLTTGKLLFNWDALNPGGAPNVPLSQAKAKPFGTVPWDAYHINSIQLIGSHEFLVSFRNTWAVYLVDASTGKIVWTLSGNPSISSFKLPQAARFEWQHDVTLLPNGEVTMFDDACCAVIGPKKLSPRNGPSRGLVLKLNTSKNTGSLVAQYLRSKTIDTSFLGSTQLLGNGNVLVGWGTQSYFTEFSRAGKVLLDARWPGNNLSYRVLLQNWVGIPSFPPSGAVRTSKGKTTVYASWDGATLLVAWRVLAGSSKTHLSTIVNKTSKTNFETGIPVTGSHTWYEVEALGSKGKVLGTSKPFTAASKPTLVGGY
jgi:hypothetical protein